MSHSNQVLEFTYQENNTLSNWNEINHNLSDGKIPYLDDLRNLTDDRLAIIAYSVTVESGKKQCILVGQNLAPKAADLINIGQYTGHFCNQRFKIMLHIWALYKCIV